MMEYFIHIASTADDLEEVVNNQIKKGWRPQGGVSVVQFSPTTVKFYQAMVRPSAPDVAVWPEPSNTK